MTDWTCRQVILDLLIEYEDGTMPAPDRADFERHVEMCPPCVRFLTTYRATGKTLKLLEHGGPAISVQFSPDGRRLATVSADRTLRVWDVTPDERSPADLLELVACRVPFRVEGGQAVHFSVFPQRCPDRL